MWDRVHDVTVGETRYRLREKGDAPDPLLCLHGLGWTGEIWRPMAGLLGARLRVVAPDMPGHGHSSAPASSDADDTVRQLLHLLDHLGIERVNVAGSSWGGLLAATLAAQHPHRVGHVFLIDGGYFSPRDIPGLTWAAYANTGLPSEQPYPTRQAYVDASRQDAPYWNGDVEAAVADQVRLAANGSGVLTCLTSATATACMRSLWDYDPTAFSTRIVAPVTVAVALGPDETPDMHRFKCEAAEKFVRGLARGHVHIMRETDHLIMLHRPRDLADLITRVDPCLN